MEPPSNLRSTLFGTHKLLPFEITIGCLVYLALASSNLQMVKGGDITQYCKGLIVSVENNHALVEESAACSQKTKTLNTTSCSLEISSIKEDLSRKTLQPHWTGPYQVLLTHSCAIKLQEVCSWIPVSHLEKALNPELTYTPTDDLKTKISKN